MNDEIAVGEHIRTKDGYIARVIEVIKRPFNDIEVKCNCVTNDFDEYYLYIDDTTKHSPNIIDLVKENDYVNGYKVRGKTHEKVVVDYYCSGGNWLTFYKDNIKTICTKEQFEKIMYRVEE